MSKEETAFRIAVLSDSHGDMDRLFLAARRIGRVDVLCFLGDVVGDAEYLQAQMALIGHSAPAYVVRGNNDFGSHYPLEITATIGGKKILLCHGHHYGVKQGLTRLALHAEAEQADIVLYGHTHVPYSGYDRGIFFLNPGSASFRRPTFALLTLDSKSFSYQILPL